MYTSKKTFTMADALEIQKQHLADWKTKLNEECYYDLALKACLDNLLVTEPYAVFRGSEMSNFVANWKPHDMPTLPILYVAPYYAKREFGFSKPTWVRETALYRQDGTLFGYIQDNAEQPNGRKFEKFAGVTYQLEYMK